MSRLKRLIGIKTVKATARHSAHGLSSKAKRRPLRSLSLLSLGAAVGAGAGFAAGRSVGHD